MLFSSERWFYFIFLFFSCLYRLNLLPKIFQSLKIKTQNLFEIQKSRRICGNPKGGEGDIRQGDFYVRKEKRWMIDYTAAPASPTRSVIFLPIDLTRQDSRGRFRKTNFCRQVRGDLLTADDPRIPWRLNTIREIL